MLRGEAIKHVESTLKTAGLTAGKYYDKVWAVFERGFANGTSMHLSEWAKIYDGICAVISDGVAAMHAASVPKQHLSTEQERVLIDEWDKGGLKGLHPLERVIGICEAVLAVQMEEIRLLKLRITELEAEENARNR